MSATIGTEMQAIVHEHYCPPDRLSVVSVPVPSARAGQVVVQVRAASVNPYDLHMITGKPYLVRTQAGLRAPKRQTPGVDVAGIITQVGDGDSSFTIGDEVFGYAKGSFAEYALCADEALVLKPAAASFDQAAATPLAGFSALQALRDKGQLQSSERVLINGAAGGVGTLAVQIAKSNGAHVTAVCSTRNLDMVSELGADRVVDYTVDDFAADRTRYDLVIDTVGNRTFATMRDVAEPNGRIVQVGGPKGGNWIQPITTTLKGMAAFAFRGPSFSPFLAHQDRDDLLALRDLLATGQLTPFVSQRFTLAETPAALKVIASGHAQGKVVIAPDECD